MASRLIFASTGRSGARGAAASAAVTGMAPVHPRCCSSNVAAGAGANALATLLRKRAPQTAKRIQAKSRLAGEDTANAAPRRRDGDERESRAETPKLPCGNVHEADVEPAVVELMGGCVAAPLKNASLCSKGSKAGSVAALESPTTPGAASRTASMRRLA